MTMRNCFGILFIVALLSGVVGYGAYRYAVGSGVLVVTLASSEAAPFSLLTLKVKALREDAVTAVEFVRKDGSVLVAPSLSKERGSIEVMTPPLLDAAGGSVAEEVGVRVITARNFPSLGRLSITASNVVNLNISAMPEVPSGLPVGALTAAHLAVAVETLSSKIKLLSPEDGSLKEALAAYKSGLEKIAAAVAKVSAKKPGSASLDLGEGKVNLTTANLRSLDRLFFAIDRRFASAMPVAGAPSRWSLIPAALAGTVCQARSEIDEFNAILTQPCLHHESVREKGAAAGGILPEAARFVYGIPMALLPVGGLMTSAGLVTKVAVSVAIAQGTDILLEPWEGISNAARRLVRTPTDAFVAYLDQLTDLPFGDVFVPFGTLVYHVNRAMDRTEGSGRASSAALLKSGPAEVRYVEVNSSGSTALKFETPKEAGIATLESDNLSKVTQEAALSVIPTAPQKPAAKPKAAPATPKTAPAPAPAPQPAPAPAPAPTPAPAPAPTPAPAPAPETPDNPTGVAALSSADCVYYGTTTSSDPFESGRFQYQVTGSGTASGDVGVYADLESFDFRGLGYSFLCGSWTRVKANLCQRGPSDPQSTQWTLTAQTESYSPPNEQTYDVWVTMGTTYDIAIYGSRVGRRVQCR